jgi:hypothetical protein
MGRAWGRCAHTLLVGEYDVKTSARRSRRRWEDNIKMDLKEIGC